MEINEKIGPASTLYITVGLRRELGRDVKIIPGTGAAIMFPQSAKLVHVIKSLEIIIVDLKHRIELQNESNPQGKASTPKHPGGLPRAAKLPGACKT